MVPSISLDRVSPVCVCESVSTPKRGHINFNTLPSDRGHISKCGRSTLGQEYVQIRVRLCSICEGRISVLKCWFKTPFTGVLFMLTLFVLEKELISWTCTAHALATLTREGRSNWGARFLWSFEFRLLFVSEQQLQGPGRAHFQVNRKGVYMTSF